MLALSRERYRSNDRGGAAALADSGSPEPDDQGAGDAGGPPGDPATDRARAEHQYYAAFLGRGLRTGSRSLYRRPGGTEKSRRRSVEDRQRRQLFREPHRYGGRQAARQAERQ